MKKWVANREIFSQTHLRQDALKILEIRTLSEVLEVVQIAEKANLRTIVSHRSGDTKDDFIADLAVGIGAYGIKAGAPKPVERRAKYERLMEIEEQEMLR